MILDIFLFKTKIKIQIKNFNEILFGKFLYLPSAKNDRRPPQMVNINSLSQPIG